MLAKGVEFEYIEQDPYTKSAQWLAINPRGLVPVVVHNGKSIYESHICIEYIDEVWPDEPRLLPQDPYSRAHARIWGDFIGKKLVSPYYWLLLRPLEDERNLAKMEFLANLLEFTKAMDPTGPFFQGKEFGYVDIMFAPWSIRMYILEHYRGVEVPQSEEFHRYHVWADAVTKHPSVKAVEQDKNRILENMKPYADGNAKSELADAVRKGSAIP